MEKGTKGRNIKKKLALVVVRNAKRKTNFNGAHLSSLSAVIEPRKPF
jgi:hypothetical protein